MDLVPRLFEVALVALALAGGSSAALADDTTPSNGGLVALPAPLALSTQDTLLPADGSSRLGVFAQKFGMDNSHLGFFSVQPESNGDLKQLLPHEAPGGGLKLQFKW